MLQIGSISNKFLPGELQFRLKMCWCSVRSFLDQSKLEPVGSVTFGVHYLSLHSDQKYIEWKYALFASEQRTVELLQREV